MDKINLLKMVHRLQWTIFLMFLSVVSLKAQQAEPMNDFPPEPGKLPVQITVTSKPFVYGSSDVKATITTDISEDVNLSVKYFDEKDQSVVVPRNAGNYRVEVDVINSSKYYGHGEGTLTIDKRKITVTANYCRKLEGSADPTLTYTVSYLVTGDQLEGQLERAPGELVGEYPISQGTLNGGSNYTIQFVENIFKIETTDFPVEPGKLKANLSLSNLVFQYDGLSKQPTLLSDPAFELSDFVWSYTQNDVEVSPVDAGIYKVKVFLSKMWKGQLYEGEAEAEMQIDPRPLTLTPDAKSKTYGEDNPDFTYTLSESLKPGNQITGRLTCLGVNCGGYVITKGDVSAGNNYVLTVNEGNELTVVPRLITLRGVDVAKVYGEQDPELKVVVEEGSLAFSDQISGTLIREEGERVGSYQILQNTAAINANYTITYLPGQFAITKRPLTITAENKSKVFGVADPELTYTLSEKLVDGDALSGVLIRKPGEAIGDYAIEQGTLTPGDNYEVTFVNGTISISKATVRVEADPKTKKYGEADPEFTYKVSAPSAAFSFSGSLTRVEGEQVGRYAIQQGTLKLNETQYELEFVSGELEILQLPVVVSAYPQSRVYGDQDPELTYAVSQTLVAGDEFTGSLSRVRGENVGVYDIVQGTLALNSNYTMTFQNNQLEIKPREIVVHAQSTTKIYGEDDPEFTYTYLGDLQFGDRFKGKLAREAGEEVGTYVIRDGDLGISDNYKLLCESALFTITQRPIEVLAINATKVFGTQDPLFTYEVSGMGLVGSDQLIGELTREAGETVGSYLISRGTLDGNKNYAWKGFEGAKFSIEQAEASIEITGLEQEYDRNNKTVDVKTEPEGLKYTVEYAGGRELPVQVGQYPVLVTILEHNYKGSKTDLLTISEPNVKELDYPKVITKDGSGEKTFVFSMDEFMKDTRLVFFNARGKAIYDKKDYTSGEFDMSVLGLGTYYFVYTYTDQKGTRREKKGFVEIVD